MREYIEALGFVPAVAVWETTLACNLHCLHCGSRAGRRRKEELDTGESLRMIRDLAGLGCKWICLSGGEPLLRKDWPVLVEAIARNGMIPSLITNGQLFTREIAQTAKDAGLYTFGVSIDGLEPTHDRIRGPGTTAKAFSAWEHAAAAGLKFTAITHVNRMNLYQLPDLHDQLADVGVMAWQVQIGRPSGNLLDNPEMLIAPRDLLELIPMVAGLVRKGRIKVVASDSIGYFGPEEEILRRQGRLRLPFFAGCMAGCRTVGIESDGWIKGCLSLPSRMDGRDDFLEGNIRQRPLADIWHDPNAFAYNRKFDPAMLQGFCAGCPYARVCRGGCRWTVSTAGHSIDNPYCHYRVLSQEASRRGKRRKTGLKTAAAFLAAALSAAGCYRQQSPTQDGNGGGDHATRDAGSGEGGMDAGIHDSGLKDSGSGKDAAVDSGNPPDAGCPYDSTYTCTIDCTCDYKDPCPDNPSSGLF